MAYITSVFTHHVRENVPDSCVSVIPGSHARFELNKKALRKTKQWLQIVVWRVNIAFFFISKLTCMQLAYLNVREYGIVVFM